MYSILLQWPEKIAGRNLNGDDPDIFIQFNNTAAWHYDPTTTPFPGLYDLATVVLHEIGHGLGFAALLTQPVAKDRLDYNQQVFLLFMMFR